MWLKFKFQSFDFERTEGRLFQNVSINVISTFLFILFFSYQGQGKGRPQGLVTIHVNILSMYKHVLYIDSIFTWIVTRPCGQTRKI